MTLRIAHIIVYTFCVTVCLMDRAHSSPAAPPVEEAALPVLLLVAALYGVCLGVIGTLLWQRRERRARFAQRIRVNNLKRAAPCENRSAAGGAIDKDRLRAAVFGAYSRDNDREWHAPLDPDQVQALVTPGHVAPEEHFRELDRMIANTTKGGRS